MNLFVLLFTIIAEEIFVTYDTVPVFCYEQTSVCMKILKYS